MTKPFDPFNQCTEYYYRIEKLLADNTALKAENESLRKDMLAAAQLNNKLLRDALKMVTNKVCWSVFTDSEETQIEESLAQPTSTEALDTYVAEKVKAARSIDEKQIAYLFEERLTLTRQRDLAVEWLERCAVHVRPTATIFYEEIMEALSTIKGSEK